MIVSVQSFVSYGYVGNSGAVYLLQASGLEVVPLHTVALSGHVGRDGWQGERTSVQHLNALWRGLEAHGCIARCQTLLAGYLGGVEAAEWLWERARALPAGALWVCDPVMGDHGRLYVSDALADFYRARATEAAALVPNHFELGLLAGAPVSGLQEARAAAASLLCRGAEVVVAKGLSFTNDPTTLYVLTMTAQGAHLIASPRRADARVGTGDAFTALMVAAAARLPPPLRWPLAAACATSATLDLIDASAQPAAAAPQGELAIPGFVPRLLPLRPDVVITPL